MKQAFILQDLSQLADKPVELINYKTELGSSLIPVRVFEQGVLTEVKYYTPGYNMVELENRESTLAIRVTIKYNRDDNGNALDRVTSREYYNNFNGQVSARKFSTKYYDRQSSYLEGKRRRTNIIDDLSAQMLELVAYNPDFVSIYNLVQEYIASYIDIYDKTIITELSTSDLEVLDVILEGTEFSIRDRMVNSLTLDIS